MKVPTEIRSALKGWPRPDREEQAFPFLTVDEDGFPHVCLLSRAELDSSADEVKAVISSTQTRLNLATSRIATLIVVRGAAAHYSKLRLIRSVECCDALGATFEIVHHKVDSVGIPLTPIQYVTSSELATVERWAFSRRVLALMNPE